MVSMILLIHFIEIDVIHQSQSMGFLQPFYEPVLVVSTDSWQTELVQARVWAPRFC